MVKNPFILLHGAWHGQWCWRNVAPLLQAEGHVVFTPDLPGHGQPHSLLGIQLSDYVSAITDLILTCNQPVTLVGHSMAGVVISQIAENIPQHIDQLIYVAAFIPGNNESLINTTARLTTPGLSTEVVLDKAINSIHLKPRSKELLFNCCKEEDIAYALPLLQDEPLQPFFDPLNLSAEKFGKVKKLYIECVHDLALRLEDQRRMHQAAGCAVATLDADHSPYFSNPTGLAALLTSKSNLSLRA